MTQIDSFAKILPTSYLTFKDSQVCSEKFFNFVGKTALKSKGNKDMLLNFSVPELGCANSLCELLEKIESAKAKKIKKIFVCLDKLQNHKRIKPLKKFAHLWINEMKIEKNKTTISAKAWGEDLKMECKNPEKVLEFLTFGES